MADNYMWFGSKERMAWIKAPNSGMGRNRVGWDAHGTYLNGGGWSRKSTGSHFEPTLTWSFLNHLEVREIEDYYLGVHGPDPFYWVDPFAFATNALPLHWSVPRLGNDDAPTLVPGQRPTLSDTPANTLALPSKMATYEISPSKPAAEYTFPIPPGFRAHLCAWGSTTGTARVDFLSEEDWKTFSPSPVSDINPTWRSVGGEWASLSFSGTGTLTLAGMVLQILPSGTRVDIPGLMTSPDLLTSPSLATSPTYTFWEGATQPRAPRFMSGAGHTGVAFKSAPQVVGYSSPQAIDYQSLTAEFIEVGAWR